MTDTSSTPSSPSLWDQFTGWVDSEFQALLSILKNFLQTALQSEVSTLVPFAEQALSELGTDLSDLFSGNLSAFAAAVGPVLVATAQKAATAGVQAAGSGLIAAVGSAVANAQPASATTPPVPSPAPSPNP